MPEDRYREELKGYIAIGGLYIRKSGILAALLAFLALSAVVASIVIPAYRKRFEAMTVFSPWVREFAGYGEIYDLDSELLYEGDISGGVFTGNGRLYRSSGGLVYEGGFQNGEFWGEGSLYGADGKLVYAGQFEMNVFHGYGELYGDDGYTAYHGDFVHGRREGLGQAYEQGVLVYDGEFVGGEYGGHGKLYGGGNLLYSGDFADGRYNGQGMLYKNGALAYDGGFLDDKYSGKGLLYESGRLIYDGEFADGLFHGHGRLYYGFEVLRYEGGFLGGLYSGQGIEYNELGRLVYQGAFSEGKRNGFGQLYSDRGNLLYDGLFIQGEIDYASLLGKRHSEMAAIFHGRAYISQGSRTVPSFRPAEGGYEVDGEGVLEEYFCEAYEELEAAVIFGAKDGEPECAEAVIVWEPAGILDYAAYSGREIPFWINVFYDNELCPVSLKNPVRKVMSAYSGLYQVYYWMENGSAQADFYTIEYRTENIGVK